MVPSTKRPRPRRKALANKKSKTTFVLPRSRLNVRFWHLADILRPQSNVRFWGVKRTSLARSQMSAFDPKRTLSRLNQISPASTNDCLVTSICSGLRCSSASRNAVKGMRDSSLENGTASWDRPNRQVLCARMPPSLGWPSRSGMMGCSLGLLSGVVLGCSQDM